MRIKSKIFGDFEEKTYFCREFPKDRKYDDQPSAENSLFLDDALCLIVRVGTDTGVQGYCGTSSA